MIKKFSFHRQLTLAHNHAGQRTFFVNRLFVGAALALTLSLTGCSGVKEQVQLPQTQTPPPAPVASYSAQSVSGDYAGYASLEQFIDEMVQRHSFERDYLRGLFSQAQRKDWTLRYLTKSDQAVKGKIAPGGWTRYRAKFVDEWHITEGVAFARSYRTALTRASRQYGVPEEYIVAILGVETKYGGYIGNHRVLDALTTLSFDYPRRSVFFTGELENFLLMTRNEDIDPTEPLGSYAGAMGLGQFMPSSFLKLAVDYNGDGRVDLWNPEDAIGSIANYFSFHGWKSGQPVVTPLSVSKNVTLKPGMSRPYTLAELTQAGLRPVRPVVSEGPYFLLLLHHAGYDQYLIGYANFYTITRYNHSVYYAMAVHELAQAIKRRL